MSQFAKFSVFVGNEFMFMLVTIEAVSG